MTVTFKETSAEAWIWGRWILVRRHWIHVRKGFSSVWTGRTITANKKTHYVHVCFSPWSVSSDGSKRVEASSGGNGSGRQDVWYPAGRVKPRARIPRPQRVNDHPAAAARPDGSKRERVEESREDLTLYSSLISVSWLFYYWQKDCLNLCSGFIA